MTRLRTRSLDARVDLKLDSSDGVHILWQEHETLRYSRLEDAGWLDLSPVLTLPWTAMIGYMSCTTYNTVEDIRYSTALCND